jgi:hypothetical protein
MHLKHVIWQNKICISSKQGFSSIILQSLPYFNFHKTHICGYLDNINSSTLPNIVIDIHIYNIYSDSWVWVYTWWENSQIYQIISLEDNLEMILTSCIHILHNDTYWLYIFQDDFLKYLLETCDNTFPLTIIKDDYYCFFFSLKMNRLYMTLTLKDFCMMYSVS